MALNAKQITRHFFVYGLGNISQTAISFLLLPLYMGHFAPEEYGVISVLFVVLWFSAMVASAGLMSALHRLYFSLQGEARKRLAGSSLAWHFGFGLIVGVTLVVFAEPVAMALFSSASRAPEVRVLGIYFVFNFSNEVPFNLLRLEERSVGYVSLSLVRFGADFVLKILLVLVARRGVVGYLESGAIAVCITFLLASLAARRFVSFRIETHRLREMLRLGLPFVLSGFAMWSLGATDKLLLNFFSGQSEVGLYAVGLKFAQIFNIVLFTPFSLLLPAIVFRHAEEHDATETKRMLAKLMNILVILGGLGYMAITLGTEDLLHVFSDSLGARQEYVVAGSLVPILTLVPFCYFLGFCSSYSLLLAKRPAFTSYAAMICAALNLLLNLILIPRWGAVGAASATAAAYVVYLGLVYHWAQQQYRVPYDWLGVGIALVCALSVSIGLWLLPIQNHVVGLLVRIPAGISVLGVVLWVSGRTLDGEMKLAIRRWFRLQLGKIGALVR